MNKKVYDPDANNKIAQAQLEDAVFREVLATEFKGISATGEPFDGGAEDIEITNNGAYDLVGWTVDNYTILLGDSTPNLVAPRAMGVVTLEAKLGEGSNTTPIYVGYTINSAVAGDVVEIGNLASYLGAGVYSTKQATGIHVNVGDVIRFWTKKVGTTTGAYVHCKDRRIMFTGAELYGAVTHANLGGKNLKTIAIPAGLTVTKTVYGLTSAALNAQHRLAMYPEPEYITIAGVPTVRTVGESILYTE